MKTSRPSGGPPPRPMHEVKIKKQYCRVCEKADEKGKNGHFLGENDRSKIYCNRPQM